MRELVSVSVSVCSCHVNEQYELERVCIGAGVCIHSMPCVRVFSHTRACVYVTFFTFTLFSRVSKHLCFVACDVLKAEKLNKIKQHARTQAHQYTVLHIIFSVSRQISDKKCVFVSNVFNSESGEYNLKHSNANPICRHFN